MLKKNCFYCVVTQKCWKNIGVIYFVLKSNEKNDLVVLSLESVFLMFCCVVAQKVLQKHWFYCEKLYTRQKNWKPQVFSIKRSQNQFLPTDSGSGSHILAWMSYEEPLQTSCLGNHLKTLPKKLQNWMKRDVKYPKTVALKMAPKIKMKS